MKFHSKAKTLSNLEISSATIPLLHIFKFKDYKKNPENINKFILKKFKKKKNCNKIFFQIRRYKQYFKCW